LQGEGYRGAYDSVQRFVRRWKADKSAPALTHAFGLWCKLSLW
jgi:hypothetical protein